MDEKFKAAIKNFIKSSNFEKKLVITGYCEHTYVYKNSSYALYIVKVCKGIRPESIVINYTLALYKDSMFVYGCPIKEKEFLEFTNECKNPKLEEFIEKYG